MQKNKLPLLVENKQKHKKKKFFFFFLIKTAIIITLPTKFRKLFMSYKVLQKIGLPKH